MPTEAAPSAPAGASFEAEFEAATAPLRGQLLAHCYRMTGSAADADDLVQETYVRAWRSWSEFEGRSSVRTWMYRIATNTCLNHLGAAGRRVLPTDLHATPGVGTDPLHPRDDVTWLEPLPERMLWQSARPTPEEEVLTRENITLAWTAALQGLSPQQRAVLLLRDVLGYSAAETAEVLGTSTASVNSALQRCRASIGDGLASPTPDRGVEDAAVTRFIAAFEAHDADAIVDCLAGDVTWQMPPFDRWYSGPEQSAAVSLTHCPFERDGDLRYLPTRANGQPAVGMYLRKGETWEAFQFQVLHVDGDGLVDHVSGWFEASLFRLAGLPLVLT